MMRSPDRADLQPFRVLTGDRDLARWAGMTPRRWRCCDLAAPGSLAGCHWQDRFQPRLAEGEGGFHLAANKKAVGG